MIRVHQFGSQCSRVFTVKNPKKILFWKKKAAQTTIGFVTTEIVWEKE